MNTIPLDEILKRISPLPYHLNGLYICQLDSPGTSVGMANNRHHAAYLTHAANNLPGLVELIDRIHRSALVSNESNPIKREWLIEECQKALAAAEKIMI